MAKQDINLGSAADDGTGDSLRSAGQKINANFAELYTAIAGAGFRAVKSTASQSITPATIEVVTFSEVFDTANGFASNAFTVPAALNGAFGIFEAGYRMTTTENGTYYIYLNGSPVAQGNFIGAPIGAGTITTGLRQLTAGEVYDTRFYSAAAGCVINNDPRTFFSGMFFKLLA